VDDVPMLAEHFLGEACRRLGVPPLKLKQRHVETLRRYNWPGNVRELQNIVERAVIRAQAGPLEFDLPGDASSNQLVSGQAASGQAVKSKSHAGEVLNYSALKQRERENLLAALEATHWRISGPSGAAKLLGLRPTTLASKIKVLGLREE
jgi:transcriptional regulator with GAF, ATPase, and Fis domain